MEKQEMNLNEMKELLGLENSGITNWKELRDLLVKSQKPNLAMLVDFYEFTMSQTFFDSNDKDTVAYFDVFFRSNPFNGGYTISGGLSDIVEYVKNFHFNYADIEYLRSTNAFSEEFLAYLKDLRFTGDMWAIPDGTPIFPNEPIITIKANIIEAQLLESLMLAYFNHGSLITTSAKRITTAAHPVKVADFGLRRGHGESVTQGSKYAAIGGCPSTSNTLAAQEYGLIPSGTMAHSLIEFYGNDYDAFMYYAKSNPNNFVALVDTYDVIDGTRAAIRVAKEYLIPSGYPFKGVRIDSGDLSYLAKVVRNMLDEEGFTDTLIFLTNGLDENSILSLKAQDTPVGAYGSGDNTIAPKERMNGVYKLVAVGEDATPRIKLSESEVKITNPGYKKVYRFYDKTTGYALGDVVAFATEVISKDRYTLISPTENWKRKTITNYRVRELQVPIFENGKLVYTVPTVEESRRYCEAEFATLYPEITRSVNPQEYYNDLSEELLETKRQLINEHRAKTKKIGQYHA